MSKVLSIMPAPFSNCMEYEKPEHPPPTTPTRRPPGTGFCCPMISRTLATAFVVSVMGGVFLDTSGALVVVTSGAVVVAIRISLALKGYRNIIAEVIPFRRRKNLPHEGLKTAMCWMPWARRRSHLSSWVLGALLSGGVCGGILRQALPSGL